MFRVRTAFGTVSFVREGERGAHGHDRVQFTTERHQQDGRGANTGSVALVIASARPPYVNTHTRLQIQK